MPPTCVTVALWSLLPERALLNLVSYLSASLNMCTHILFGHALKPKQCGKRPHCLGFDPCKNMSSRLLHHLSLSIGKSSFCWGNECKKRNFSTWWPLLMIQWPNLNKHHKHCHYVQIQSLLKISFSNPGPSSKCTSTLKAAWSYS